MLHRLAQLTGIELSPVSHRERLASAIGGFVGILATITISSHYLDVAATAMIVASMGASAVLLFAVPHGALSQPWPALGGHLVSAVIGVGCARLVPHTGLAAALAVGLAIGAMHYLRCIHPPGGATALTAVVGGSGVHELGYAFVVTPVLMNIAVLLAVAVLFNYLFPWRRYPAALRPTPPGAAPPPSEAYPPIAHADLVAALSQIDSFIDVTESDLLRIYDLATQAGRGHLTPTEIRVGGYYSNGEYGTDWSVRQVIADSGRADPDRDVLRYLVVAGTGRRDTGATPRTEFARWARYEVIRVETSWQRVNRGDRHGAPPAASVDDASAPR